MEENKNIQNEQSSETSANEAAEKCGFFANKKNVYIVAAIAAVAIVAGIVLAVVLGGGKDTPVDNDEDPSEVGGEGDEKNETTALPYGNTNELINLVWDKFPAYDDNGTPEEFDDFVKYVENEDGTKSYYYNGGWIVDEEWNLTQTEGAAGNVMLDEVQIDQHLGVPASMLKFITEASSLCAMNQNMFTCGAYKLTEDADIAAFAAAVEENIQNRMWMCGFPESVVIVKAPGNYVLSFFGQSFVDTFVAELLKTVDGAEVLIDNPIR